MNKCSIEGCTGNSKRIVKSYCLMHYTRLRTKGELGPAQKLPDSWGTCLVENCSTKAGPTGACRRHWHSVNSPDRSRKRSLKYKGLTIDDYERILKEQGGGCKICGTKTPGHQRKNFAVDHDHTCCPGTVKHCGKCFRGLLCTRCNLILGELKDDTELLNKMITYLNQ
jgi:hypothetical protein